MDGSILEGGGQIIRQSVALATLTRRPLTLVRIRAGRSKPGLRAQHKAGIDLVATLSGAAVRGVAVTSEEVTYIPAAADRCWTQTKLLADAGGGGSVALMAQIALPVMCFARFSTTDEGSAVELTLRGGTNAGFSPPIEFTEHVLAPTLRRVCGVELGVDIAARGGSWGGGEVHPALKPRERATALPPIVMLERGAVRKVVVHVWTRGSYGAPCDFAARAAESAIRRVAAALGRTPLRAGEGAAAAPLGVAAATASADAAAPLLFEVVVEASPAATGGGGRGRASRPKQCDFGTVRGFCWSRKRPWGASSPARRSSRVASAARVGEAERRVENGSAAAEAGAEEEEEEVRAMRRCRVSRTKERVSRQRCCSPILPTTAASTSTCKTSSSSSWLSVRGLPECAAVPSRCTRGPRFTLQSTSRTRASASFLTATQRRKVAPSSLSVMA